MTAIVATNRMDDLQWPRILNKVITQRWSELKNTLVMKDFVDHLIQKRVVTLDYWMGLKSKPISESERTEDFLSMVMKFDKQKYNYFLEALLSINRQDLVKELVKAHNGNSKKVNDNPEYNTKDPSKNASKKIEHKIVEIGLDKRKNIKGQTDADEPPSGIDGHNASLEPKQNKAVDKNKALEYQAATTQKLFHGIGTVNKKETPDNKAVNAKSSTPIEVKPNTPINEKVKKTLELEDMKTPDNMKVPEQCKEESLALREKMIENKESELSKKELELKEHEQNLKQKESELKTRENSLLTIKTGVSQIGPLPLPLHAQLHQIQTTDGSNPPTASTTQSSEILADVRDQLAAMRTRKEEIESEHTTVCSTPKGDYVRLRDFQNIQQDIDDIKEEIATDRESRQTVRQKIEDLNHEIEGLHRNIKVLQEEKATTQAELNKELNKLKNEMKTNKLNHNESINRIKMEMKSKDEHCVELKENIEKVKKNADDLEARIKLLEQDKMKYEMELQRYDKEVSDLRQTLEQKENELRDLRHVLEETENEKEDLIDELANLKNEVHRLKSDKKRLEQEKKTLLARCVKPNWNQNPSNGGVQRRTPFSN